MIDRRLFGVAMALVFASSAAFGMQEIPKASAKALGVTRGKPFSSGVVFIEGKYLPPPYVVERWGNGIRINSKTAVGPVVPWSDFIKTQDKAKLTKTETVTAAPPPAAASPAPSSDDDDTSLDDLFDDEPKPKKAKKKAVAQPAAPAAPKTTVSYSLVGSFEPNATTRSYVARINAVRTEIDRMLRSGGFICFGESYSRVNGDARSALSLMEKLPVIMRSSETLGDFRAAVRAAGLVYLNEILCEELFRNKVDYPRLIDRYERMKRDSDTKTMLEQISQPLL